MSNEIAILLTIGFCLLGGYLVGFQKGRAFTEKNQDRRLRLLRKTPADKLYIHFFKPTYKRPLGLRQDK